MIYVEQYDRTKRFLARFELDSNDPVEGYDDLCAFFILCYHIKDWIKNEPKFIEDTLIGEKVENYINTNPHLCLCAGLANGTKHFKRNSNPRYSDTMPTLNLNAEASNKVVFTYTVTQSNGVKMDALQLAKKCIRAWDKFIARNTELFLND